MSVLFMRSGQKPQHRAAKRAAVGDEGGTLPWGDRVKQRQRRALRALIGGRAFVRGEREQQRAVKRGNIRAVCATVPRERAHTVFRVGFARVMSQG